MRLTLCLLLFPTLATATPVMVPKIQGLPITEPASPAPPPCTQVACPVRT